MNTSKKKATTQWFLIANPTAGGGKVAKSWNMIIEKFKAANISYDFAKTEYKNHATTLTQQAIEKGYRHIIAIGGDGTANEVANGICQQNIIPTQEITFALLPIGTGNDWIKTHRIPKNINTWINCLKKEKTSFQDIGIVHCQSGNKPITRYFINVAGMAFDAFVTKASEGKSKYFIPKLQFLLLTLKCLFKYQLTPAQLFYEDKKVEEKFYTINVGICKYSGGGMQLVPHAIPDDGTLALTYVGNASKLIVFLNSWRFYGGKVLNFSKTKHSHVSELSVEADTSTPLGVEVDGEYIGETPVQFSIIKKGLNIIVP